MKIKNEKYKIISYITITCLLVSLIFPAIFYTQLPEQIPIHFNAKGQADNYAEKINLWIIPLLGLILYNGLYSLDKYLKSKKSESQNKDVDVARKIFRIMNLIISLSFSYITIQIVLTALKKSDGLGSWFIFVFMFSIIFFPMIPLINKGKTIELK